MVEVATLRPLVNNGDRVALGSGDIILVDVPEARGARLVASADGGTQGSR